MVSNITTWKDIIAKRQKENFVGREDYLNIFTENVKSDIPKYLLFFITGEGGVGKSTLLDQLMIVARDTGVESIIIQCSEEQSTPVTVMGSISEQLKKHNYSYKGFDDLYKKYLAHKEEIESDPKAPRGAIDLVVRGMTDFAIKSARRTPGIGVFADYLDEKAAGDALSEGLNYLITNLGNKDEVKLLREPEMILTPQFIELLNIASENNKIALFFDVFERTREALEPWLLEFLSFKYGEFRTNLTFVISGRDMPDQRWTKIASSICNIALEPFTFEETRIYLSNRGIIEESLVDKIFKDTGGLPVLIELLAGTDPNPNAPLPDISKDAVKRFLQWVPEKEKQHVALLAAIPRSFNQDIINAVLDCNSTENFFWLSTQSYIRTNTKRGWFYHEKIRELMLRYLSNTTPNDLIEAHTKLFNFFNEKQALLNLEGGKALNNNSWCELEIERIYHQLSSNPINNILNAINSFLSAIYWSADFAENILQVIDEVANDTSSKEVFEIYKYLSDFYQNYCNNSNFIETIKETNYIISNYEINNIGQLVIFFNRGYAYLMLDQYSKALEDFNKYLSIDKEDGKVLLFRGLTHSFLKNNPEAISDISEAINLNNNNNIAFVFRGETFINMKKYQEAIDDFNQAIELNNKDGWVFKERGKAFRQMQKYQDALDDFSQAIELDNNNEWALAERAETYRIINEDQKAIDDFTRAIALDENFKWALLRRGETYRHMEEYQNAIADFDRIIILDEKNDLALAERGETYRKMGEDQKAIDDFTRAIALDENYKWALLRRGETYRHMKEYQNAIADFDRIIILDENSVLALVERGETYRIMGEDQKAIDDFTRAIALDENFKWALLRRGETYRHMEEYQNAIADFDRIIILDEKNDLAIAQRGETYRMMGQFQEAIEDFNQAIALDEDFGWAINQRDKTIQQIDNSGNSLKT